MNPPIIGAIYGTLTGATYCIIARDKISWEEAAKIVPVGCIAGAAIAVTTPWSVFAIVGWLSRDIFWKKS